MSDLFGSKPQPEHLRTPDGKEIIWFGGMDASADRVALGGCAAKRCHLCGGQTWFRPSYIKRAQSIEFLGEGVVRYVCRACRESKRLPFKYADGTHYDAKRFNKLFGPDRLEPPPPGVTE